jgi:hypothetical protein
LPQNALMSKKKPATGDRHKPARMVRIRASMTAAGDALAERLATDFTELVNIALREFLERHDVWPPPREKE